MDYRFATSKDAAVLASLNQNLIRDEGHRNPMTIEQLTARMAGWLDGDYEAIIFESDATTVGYVLFRRDPEFVYVRHFFVIERFRRKGIGRNAIRWLWQNAWSQSLRLRVEVLIENVSGHAFWRSVGFQDYCVTLEATPPEPVSESLSK